MSSSFPLALVIAAEVSDEHVNSARPDAPVIEDAPAHATPRLRRTRGAVATALHRAAAAVEPAEVSPAR
jgi:hypothetical protein